MLNKIGSKIDSWVTPRVTSNHPLKEEPISTCCLPQSILGYSC